MTERVNIDGSVFLCGNPVDVADTLDEYFSRGYMLLPGCSSVHADSSQATVFCTVHLPEDFLTRAGAREQWSDWCKRQGQSKAEAKAVAARERARKCYLRKRAA